MAAWQPTRKPQMDRTDPRRRALSERPGIGEIVRTLALLAGVAAALVAFFVVGVYAVSWSCEGAETRGLCVNLSWLVPVLEWPIGVLSVLAPLVGGIASFLTARPRWLGLGVVVAFVMFGLMSLVSIGQTVYT